MYRLTDGGSVIRLSDNASIPMDDGNKDYVEYLAWIAAGKTPEPAPAPDMNAAILAQIDAIEIATGVPRVVREMMLIYAEDLAARTAEQMTASGQPTIAEQLLMENIAYVKTKAVDDQIRALRSQLK